MIPYICTLEQFGKKLFNLPQKAFPPPFCSSYQFINQFEQPPTSFRYDIYPIWYHAEMISTPNDKLLKWHLPNMVSCRYDIFPIWYHAVMISTPNDKLLK